MASRSYPLTSPDPKALTVLLEPFSKQPGQSSLPVVTNLLRRLFPQETWNLYKADTGQPLHLSGQWQLSVSHSGGFLAVAVSKLRCGIDLEVLRHPHRWRQLYTWITPSDEQISAPTETDFLRAWTIKEALLKLQGLGLNGRLDCQPVPCRAMPGWQNLYVDNCTAWVQHEQVMHGMSLALACDQPLPVHWFGVSDDSESGVQ